MNPKRLIQALAFVYSIFILQMSGAFLHPIEQKMDGEKMVSDRAAMSEETIGEKGASAVGKSDIEKPKIAITFDDGPNTQYTPKLLDGLKERGVKATFFLIGKNIEEGDNKEIVRREYEEGHLLGNHTYSHVDITKISDEEAYKELKRNDDVLYDLLGTHFAYMRPPFGVWQKPLEQQLNVIPVLWTVDPLDWTTENVDEIVNKVVTETQEGDIILLHDCYQSSVDAALRIIDILHAEGYEFVTVDELIMN